MQTSECVKPGYPLFTGEDYQATFARKRVFEEAPAHEKLEEVFQWTTTEAYKQLNFQREALTINPAKACQPLGAVLCALGFHKTLPYVHGSQGCVAYFRTYFNRHFREPIAAVSDSMTEDAAVFGGQKNMFEGLENSLTLYKPEMIAVSTTCMAEVIGDDLNAFITNAKKDGRVPMDFPTPFAHTPSFVGSHITGWDNMLEGILRYFTLFQSAPAMMASELAMNHSRVSNGKLNIVTGFESYLGNLRVIKRMLKEMGVAYTFLSDPEEILDTPDRRRISHVRRRHHASRRSRTRPTPSTPCCCNPGSCPRPRNTCRKPGSTPASPITIPMGLSGTDEFLMKVSELTGKPIPDSLAVERGRLVDMMTDSHSWLHGKRFSVFGDPDFVTGLCQFLLELGAEPLHVLCHNGNKRWAKDITRLLKDSPYGQGAEVHVGKDLWHLRSLVFADKPDFLIGNSYGKFIQRDTLHKGREHEVPLIRFGFPLFDRHHLHRDTTLGYEGAMHILKTLVNAVMERLDQETMTHGRNRFRLRF